MIGLYADRGGIRMRKRQSGARLLPLISYPSHSPARSALSSRKPTHLPAPSPPSGPHVGSCEEQKSLPLPYFTAVAEAKQNSFPWEERWKRNSTKMDQLLRRIASVIFSGGVQVRDRACRGESGAREEWVCARGPSLSWRFRGIIAYRGAPRWQLKCGWCGKKKPGY